MKIKAYICTVTLSIDEHMQMLYFAKSREQARHHCKVHGEEWGFELLYSDIHVLRAPLWDGLDLSYNGGGTENLIPEFGPPRDNWGEEEE